MMIALALALVAAQDTTRLTLTSAVDRALGAYPTVAMARAAVARAGADLGDARAQRRPRLHLEGSATRFQEPMLVYPLHGFPTAPLPAGSGAPTFDRTLLQGSAFLNWTLWDFGQRAARIRAAASLAGAADAALSGAEAGLAERTAAAYLRVLTARDVLAAQDERLRALAAESARIALLLAEGRAARIEQLRIDAEAARARADQVATQAQLEVATRDLAQLVNAAGPLALAPVAWRDTAAVAASRDVLIAEAQAASTDALESRRRADAARAGSDLARAGRLPELRLAGGIVDRGRGSGDFAAEWQAGVAVSWALWTGGSRAAQIRRADADLRVADAQRRLTDLGITQSVDRALAAVDEARARVAALRTAVTQSEEVAAIERTALEIGSGTQTDWLEAEAGLLRARASLIEARHADIAARITLARVTGRLTPAWLAAQLQ